MTVYIDENFICHRDDDGTRQRFELSELDGKCRELIEGYRYVPAGQEWRREDGTIFQGEMLSPCREYGMLEQLQDAYESMAELVSQIYETDMEEIENVQGNEEAD